MNLRLLIKGLIWESTGILIMWIITGNFHVILKYFGIRVLLYVPYHMMWKKINLFKKKVK